MIFSSATSANYILDSTSANPQAWTPVNNQLGEWIQVSAEGLKWWTGVVVQGRGDHPSWVTSVKISYTRNGSIWKHINDGKVFAANIDQNQQLAIDFDEPVCARALRIYPQTWHNGIAMRFDAVYVELP